MTHILRKIYFLMIFIIFAVTSTSGYSISNNDLVIKPSRNSNKNMPMNHFFKKSYLSLGLTRNFPAYYSKNKLSTNHSHPVVSYSFFLNQNWMLELGMQFKILKISRTNEDAALASFYQESSYLIRLSYPTYFFIGGQFLYITPIKKALIPMQRLEEYPIEVGAGLQFGFLYELNSQSFYKFTASRWRGTKSMRLHGYQVSVAYAYSLL